MKFTIENNQITNPTLMCLLEWSHLIQEHITEDDKLFDTMEDVGRQIEYFRTTHQQEDINDDTRVTVHMYSENEILISDKNRGEYIRIKNLNAHGQH